MSTAGRLRSRLMDGSDPVLLLGAGASITSGIPAAAKTVERVARWTWCKACKVAKRLLALDGFGDPAKAFDTSGKSAALLHHRAFV
jgi:hypothetical protein